VGSSMRSIRAHAPSDSTPPTAAPPHVQSPLQPGTSHRPESQLNPPLANSSAPMQQARCPSPPHGFGWTHVPSESKPSPAPPHRQLPLQPGTSIFPGSHATPPSAYSATPQQQARSPAPPQEVIVRQVPSELKTPSLHPQSPLQPGTSNRPSRHDGTRSSTQQARSPSPPQWLARAAGERRTIAASDVRAKRVVRVFMARLTPLRAPLGRGARR